MNTLSHHLRFFLTILLSISLFYVDLSTTKLSEVREFMSSILIPFRVAASFPKRSYQAVDNYFRARESLLSEKFELEKQLQESTVRLQSLEFFTRQNQELRQLLKLKERTSGKWIAAERSNNFTQPFVEQIYLNKGSADGVFPGMGIVDEYGVIGQVVRSDLNTSVVSLLTNIDQWIAARIERNNLLIVLRGDGDGRLLLQFVPNSADVKVGDKLFADGKNFPPGFPIAVIEELKTGSLFLQAIARPLGNLKDNTSLLIYDTITTEEEVQ